MHQRNISWCESFNWKILILWTECEKVWCIHALFQKAPPQSHTNKMGQWHSIFVIISTTLTGNRNHLCLIAPPIILMISFIKKSKTFLTFRWCLLYLESSRKNKLCLYQIEFVLLASQEANKTRCMWKCVGLAPPSPPLNVIRLSTLGQHWGGRRGGAGKGRNIARKRNNYCEWDCLFFVPINIIIITFVISIFCLDCIFSFWSELANEFSYNHAVCFCGNTCGITSSQAPKIFWGMQQFHEVGSRHQQLVILFKYLILIVLSV